MEDPRVALKVALKQAMIGKDTITRDAIRMLNAAIKQVEVDTQKELSAEDVVSIIQKEVKKLRDSIEEKRNVGREELIAEDESQLAVIEQFLPQQLSREEIETIVKDVIAETGASSPKEMGKVMGALMPKVKGRADGKLVNEVVRELLNS